MRGPSRGPGALGAGGAIALPAGRPLWADGATGTELLARGLPPGVAPEAWVLERPDEVRAVHAAHAAAGAELVLTCTFGANRVRLAAAGLEERLDDVCGRAATLARAGAPGARIAGSLGPTGLPGADVRAAFAAPARALAAAGVDLLWLETRFDGDEALAALDVALEAGLPVAVTVTPRRGERVLPDGADAAELLWRLARAGAAAVGINCAAPGPALAAIVADAEALLAGAGVPLALKPDAGLPGERLAPEAWAAAVAPLAVPGRIVGGCCGASPEHLRALVARVSPGERSR